MSEKEEHQREEEEDHQQQQEAQEKEEVYTHNVTIRTGGTWVTGITLSKKTPVL